jgi:hypothetical protein
LEEKLLKAELQNVEEQLGVLSSAGAWVLMGAFLGNKIENQFLWLVRNTGLFGTEKFNVVLVVG